MQITVTCHPEGVIGEGSLESEVLICGIAAGEDEYTRTKRPFTGPAGRLLSATLDTVGYRRESCYLTNLICGWNDTPSNIEIEACLPRLRQELEAVKPKLIVTLGEIVTDAFGITSDFGKSFSQLRGSVLWSKRYNRWVLPCYHPAAFLYKERNVDIADFARDLAKIKDIVKWPAGYQPWHVPYHVCYNVEEAERVLWDLEGEISIDVETTWAYKDAAYIQLAGDSAEWPEYLGGKLLCFSVSNGFRTWVIPGPIAKDVTKGWGSRKEVTWVMHGGLFDIAQLRNLLGESLTLGEDTMLESYSLDERGGKDLENNRAVGVHGLKKLAREYVGADFYDVNVLEALPEELHQYNAKDAYYTIVLHNLLVSRQVDDNVRSMYEDLLLRGANVLSEIQDYGMHVDLGELERMAGWLRKKWIELEAKIQGEVLQRGYRSPKARKAGITDAMEIDVDSPKQLAEFIYDYLGAPVGREGRTTKATVMEQLASAYPWCEWLMEFRQINHMLSTYIEGVKDDVDTLSRVHPQPALHGTRSGRLAYHNPPIQTIPSKGVASELAQIRRMFSATSKDYIIVEADLKQAELWATWFYSGDEALLQALESGDVHGETAKDMFLISETSRQWPTYRFMAKRFNFGVLYGLGPTNFSAYMNAVKAPDGSSLPRWSIREANAYIKRWERKYPKVVQWRRKEMRTANELGEQQSMTGRKRRYWLPNEKTLSQSVNYGPQALAHDILFDSLIKLHYLLKEFDGHILCEVHDSLVFEVRRQYLDESLALIERVMTEPKFGLPRGIPVEIKKGPNYYDVA